MVRTQETGQDFVDTSTVRWQLPAGLIHGIGVGDLAGGTDDTTPVLHALKPNTWTAYLGIPLRLVTRIMRRSGRRYI
jgi:hypothetical protein